MRDHGATIVQQAIDIEAAGKEIDALLVDIRKGEALTEMAQQVLTDRRYRAGLLFDQVRRTFPPSGPKAAGWAKFCDARGVSKDTAARYIETAKQVQQHPELAIGLSWMDLYRKLGLNTEPPKRQDLPLPAANYAASQHNDPKAQPRRNDAQMFTSASECWLTPPEVRDPLLTFARSASVALDPCSHFRSIIPARHRWFGLPQAESDVGRALLMGEVDGLREDWRGYLLDGDLAFVNPPYGRAFAEWAAKVQQEADRGAEIIALVPARTDTAWWVAMRPAACRPPASCTCSKGSSGCRAGRHRRAP